MNYPYNNPYYQQGYQQNAQSFNCRPVTSKEEAISMPTNFYALGDLMPDLAHGVIYLKRFNPNTGTSEFYEFRCDTSAQQAPQYATIEMLNNAVEELKSELGALNKPKRKGNEE